MPPQMANPNFGQLSPLTAQLQTGGSQGPNWSYAYGGFLPRLPQDFTEGAFGPFSPILPVPVDSPASEDTPRAEPRWWEYPVGWNLPVGTPGSEGGTKLADFNTLKTLADLYSVARACIELRKNEIRGLNWDIMPTKDAAKAMRGSPTKAADFGRRRSEAIKFFNHCDPDYSTWTEWLGVVLEEILVYDTCALLMQPSWGNSKGVLGSDLKHLRLVTAPTIRPLVDMHGAKPRPPAPAFQQYLFGVPRTDLMTMITQEDIEDYKGLEGPAFRGDQLLYHRMTPRRWTPYGFAPVEQALIPVMAGLQKQGYQLDFFREGTVPAVYVSPGGTNANMTPNQIRELQDALNAIAGDVAWKHKIIVLPSDSKVMPQKPTEIADQFDEIVMTQVCMAFGVQPMELGIMPKVSTSVSPGASNQMAKASQGTHERKATKPMLTFLTSIFNMVLQDVCGQDDMQFMFEGLEEDEDETAQTTMLVQQIGAGLRSIDEARGELGLQPWGLPETVDPGWATATGFVPLGQLTATGDVAPGQQPTANAPATATPPGQAPAGGSKPAGGVTAAKPTGGPAKPTEPDSGAAPAKPAPKKPSGSNGSSANPGHAAAQAADTAGASKTVTPVISKAQEAHQARRDKHVAAAGAHVRETIKRTVKDYQKGKVTHAQALTDATQVLADGYQQAMEAASQDAVNDYDNTMPVDFSGSAMGLAAQQQSFLAGLLYVAIGMAGVSWLNSRLTAYENTVSNAYNTAFGETIQSSHPEYQIIWHLGSAEHCSLCIARDGKSFTFHSLPGYPGDGGFGGPVCQGGPNCHCSLEYVHPEVGSLWGENTQRPWAQGYYQQQLQDITAAREETIANREAFLADIPEPAQARAMTRDQVAQELADLQNAQIRAGGGYPGVSVEWGDITAQQILDAAPEWSIKADVAGLLKAQDSELAALARHYRKGRPIISWKPRHIDSMMLMSIEEDVTKGLTIEQAVDVAKGTVRRVLINGQITQVPDPDYQQLPTPAARVPAGGGGRVFPAHDVNDIEVGAGRRSVMSEPTEPIPGPEVPGGVPGPTAGGEPPRWAPPEGTSNGETMSKPRRRVRSAPPDEDDADYPESRAAQPAQGGGPSGGAPQMASIGSAASPVTGIPGANKGSTVTAVKELMLSNFPQNALTWVDRADWSGPAPVPLADIDFDDEDTWAAHHQSSKVDDFKAQIEAGKTPHPAIMVKEPGDPKLKVVDGHHRTLAYKALGKPVPAYIGRVAADEKAWEETHSSQLHQGSDSANKAGKVSKESVNYRHHQGEKMCGNCSMFRVSGDDESGSCTLVAGEIRSDDVCDEWAPMTKGISPAVLKMAEQLHKAGNPTALRNWYASGAGGAVNWGGPGDLTACHAIASRHMSSDQAWGFCQERHIQATGKPNPRND